MIDAINAFVQAHQAVISLVILGIVFVGFTVERYPATVIAIFGACAYLALGILDAEGMYSVFSNSAPIVIGRLFERLREWRWVMHRASPLLMPGRGAATQSSSHVMEPDHSAADAPCITRWV